MASITNIYYDCLEHIFNYLDLQSLMNVAGTCKGLKIAAAEKFNHDHGEKTIVLIPKPTQKSRIFNESHGIEVIGLKMCRSFLWSFGEKISHLVLHEKPGLLNLEQDINEYCANTLKSYQCFFRKNQQSFSLENNPKLFQHVEKVGITGCAFHGHFTCLNALFPNLRHLDLKSIDIDKDCTAAISIPHLERLEIVILPRKSFGLKEATDLIKANRQLRELLIDSFEYSGNAVFLEHQEIKLAELLNMISGNTSISKLSVRLELTNVSTDELKRFAAEHPLMEELALWRCPMTANDVIVFIRELNSLKEIRFNLVDGAQYDGLEKELDKEWKIERNCGWFSTSISRR